MCTNIIDAILQTIAKTNNNKQLQNNQPLKSFPKQNTNILVINKINKIKKHKSFPKQNTK